MWSCFLGQCAGLLLEATAVPLQVTINGFSAAASELRLEV